MARLNWNRPRRIHVPWYDDPTRDVPGIDSPMVARSRRAISTHTVDNDASFFAMLDARPDQYDHRTPVAPSLDKRIEAAKASLVGATTAVVHADGGCSPNPGVGGWGVTVDVQGREPLLLWGGAQQSTNNKMELTAAVVALSVLPATCAVSIVSDSQYLIKGMTEWIANWKRKNFEKGGFQIPNADLWLKLDALSAGRRIRWEWIRGHSGHAGNERVDRLAARGIREATNGVNN